MIDQLLNIMQLEICKESGKQQQRITLWMIISLDWLLSDQILLASNFEVKTMYY